MSKITTVIFDIGGVLTEYEERQFYVLRGYSEEMADRLYLATMRSGHWVQFDLGILSQREIVGLFQQTDPEIADDIAEALSDVSLLVRKREAAIPWIRAVRAAGYRALYLSNFSEQAHRECHEALSFVGEMDGGIFSFQDHLVKPGEEIYRHLMQMHGLTPQECVFIDDTRRNLDTAERLGMHVIQYRDQQQAERELWSLLGKI